MLGMLNSLKSTEPSLIWIEHHARRVRKVVSSSERLVFGSTALWVLVNVLRKTW